MAAVNEALGSVFELVDAGHKVAVEGSVSYIENRDGRKTGLKRRIRFDEVHWKFGSCGYADKGMPEGLHCCFVSLPLSCEQFPTLPR